MNKESCRLRNVRSLGAKKKKKIGGAMCKNHKIRRRLGGFVKVHGVVQEVSKFEG